MDESPPFLSERLQGPSNFVIVVDHASSRIPRCLGDLGLPSSELQRHIAWDIGGLAVAREIAAALDAPLVAQEYSRLVIDCNRSPGTDASIPKVSEWTQISGNIGLSDEEVSARRIEIFEPYHRQISALLDARLAARRRTILIALHSMTEEFKGERREMHGAVLYNRDRRFAGLLLDSLRCGTHLAIADNEPYSVSDETDYTIPHHGEARALPHAAIEIRQDLVNTAAGATAWAMHIAVALRAAEHSFFGESQ